MKAGILACALVAAGCGSDADVAGNYTVALTNGTNGCQLGNFNEGDSSSGVQIGITQEGSHLTLTVMGVAALYLGGLLGANGNVFTGDVDGDDISVTATGVKPNTTGNCTFTYNSHISGTLDGDVLRGKIEYRAADNGNSDCSQPQIHGCLTFQDYNGTRPPQ